MSEHFIAIHWDGPTFGDMPDIQVVGYLWITAVDSFPVWAISISEMGSYLYMPIADEIADF